MMDGMMNSMGSMMAGMMGMGVLGLLFWLIVLGLLVAVYASLFLLERARPAAAAMLDLTDVESFGLLPLLGLEGPFEIVAAFRVVQVLLIEPSATAYAIYAVFFELGTLFHHSNVGMPVAIERASHCA